MSNDTLFDEIEQFLANGGEPAEPTPEEQLLATVEAFRDAVSQAMNDIVEVFQPLWDAIIAWARHCCEWLSDFVIGLRRDQLRVKLEAWRLPRLVARWIAARWPKRWLPELVLPPPEIVT